MVIAEWLQGVQEYLADEFPTHTVRIGEPDEEDTQNQRDEDLILIWWEVSDQYARDIALATPIMFIRWLPTKSRKAPRTTNPDDPIVLAEAAEALMVAMKAKRRFGDFAEHVACHVSSVRPVTKPKGSWYVQATVQGVSPNLATSAA